MIFQTIFTIGEVNVLVTVTATEDSVISTVPDYEDNIGLLSVKVLQATGFESRRLAKRLPYVVLELVNQHVQTRTREGVDDLTWNKKFYFTVSDIYTELEVTVIDDADKSFLGKVKEFHWIGRVVFHISATVGYSPHPLSVW